MQQDRARRAFGIRLRLIGAIALAFARSPFEQESLSRSWQ